MINTSPAYSRWILRSAVVAAVIGTVAILPGGALAEPAGWNEFEQRLDQGEVTDYERTRTRRVDYVHPRDIVVGKFVAVVDGFFDFVDAEVAPLAPDRRFKVLVSRDPTEHGQKMRTLFGDKNQTAMGTYYPREGVLATYVQTGPGTVTSLLTYPILDTHTPKAPSWARSAIATFFEKVFAYPGPDGRLIFRVGFHNPWRIAEVSGCLDRLDLNEIISKPNYAGGASHFRLIATFLWRHGRFKNLIERLRDGDLRGRENYLAAAFDRPMSEVAALWRDYLAEIPGQRYAIDRTPLSQIYATQAEFEAAMAAMERKPSWREHLMQRVIRLIEPAGCPIKTDGDFSRLATAGEALAKVGDYTGAIDQFSKALALIPPSKLAESSVLTYRARAFSSLGKLEEALRDLNRAVTADRNVFALGTRGDTLRKMGRFAEALTDYDAAIQMSPDDIFSHVGRGVALWRLGQFERANASFDHALALKPGDTYALTSRARFFVQQKNFERALEDYNAAERLDKDNSAVYSGRGWLHEKQGRLDLARADYEQGLQVAPGDPWLRQAIDGLSRRK